MSSELHTLTGAYALHALPPDEEAEFERHLRECDDCTQEVRELEATTAHLGAAATTTPPPELRRRVMAQVATVRQVPPLPRAVPPGRRRWWAQPASLAAAALLVACAGLGAVVLDQRADLAEARQEAEAVTSVLADPDRRIASASIGDATVTVVLTGDQAVFLANALQALPEDRTYQLWALRDGGTDIRSAGLIEEDSGAVQSLLEDLGDVDAIAVSVEPEGGSEQPTEDQILGAVPLA